MQQVDSIAIKASAFDQPASPYSALDLYRPARSIWRAYQKNFTDLSKAPKLTTGNSARAAYEYQSLSSVQ